MAGIVIPVVVGAVTGILSYYLTPKPRTDRQSPDLRLPGSEYARELPKLYGENKFAGNFIAFDTIEKCFRKVRRRVSTGKGGGRTTAAVYDVYGDFMFAFCEGPCSLQKLTIQGKTFIGDGASPSWEGAYFSWFNGSTTQSAWSVAQTKDGAGATPAYRGIALGAIDDLPLARYSDTFPQVIHAVLRDEVLGANPRLGSVIKSICNRAGYSDEEIDISELQNIRIKGFNLRQNGNTYRSSLEDLLTIYLAFIAYDDGVLTFRLYDRGSSPSSLIIPYTGIGAHDFNGEAPYAIEKTVPYPIELPKKLFIEFYNPNKDYERDSAVSVRSSADNENEQSLNTELVLTASEAKTQSQKLLDQVWIQSNVYKFYLPPRYLLETGLKVGNIIVLPNGDQVQLRSIKIGANYLLECEAHFYLPAVYNYTITVPENPRASIVYQDPSEDPAQLYLLDTNLINDTDADFGLYICSNKDDVTVYGTFNGTDYDFVITVGERNAIGTCDDVLGGGVSVNLVDRKNTLTVTINSMPEGGQLETVTNSQFYGLTNLAFVGRQIDGKWQGEYIGFQQAQLIAPNQYRLSTLIRGAKGTEAFIDNHTEGETFILMRGSAASIYRTVGSTLALGVPLGFKGLQSDFEDFYTLPSFEVVPEGNASKPYDTTLTASLHRDSATGNLTIAWNRRERKNAAWGLFEVPLAEGFENYSLDIYNGTNNIRSVKTSDTTYTYTSADQVLDFGSNQTSLTIRIRQQGFTDGFWGYGVKADLAVQSVT